MPEQPTGEFKGKTLRDYLESEGFKREVEIDMPGHGVEKHVYLNQKKLFITDRSGIYITHALNSGKNAIFKVSLLSREQAYRTLVPEDQGLDYRDFDKEEFLRRTKSIEDITFIHCTFFHRDYEDGYFVANSFSHYIPLDHHLDDKEVFLHDHGYNLSFEPEPVEKKSKSA